MRRIHGKKVTFHANEIAFLSFHRTNKMALCVTLEELPMNDVNVFANINDHKFIDLCLPFPRVVFYIFARLSRFPGTNSNDSHILTDKKGKIDTNLAWQRPPKTLQFIREINKFEG